MGTLHRLIRRSKPEVELELMCDSDFAFSIK